MKWIEFGTIDYKIIIPLIYPFLYQIRILFHKEENKPIFFFFTNFFGYLFSGIIYLVIKCWMKRNKSEDLENIDTINKNKSIAPGENSFELVRKISYYNLGDNQIKIEADKIIRKRKRNQYLFILM